MKCFRCSTDAEARKEDYVVQSKDCFIIVRRVPCFVCSKCGEILCPAPITNQLEEYAHAVKKVMRQLCLISYEDLGGVTARILKGCEPVEI